MILPQAYATDVNYVIFLQIGVCVSCKTQKQAIPWTASNAAPLGFFQIRKVPTQQKMPVMPLHCWDNAFVASCNTAHHKELSKIDAAPEI